MVSFQQMFMESKGQPITYKGNTLVMADDFPLDGCRRLRLVFESCNGEWRQGVYMRILHKKSNFIVKGQRIPGKNGTVMWEDTAPQTVEFEADTDSAAVEVRNVWDVGDGVMHSWHNGAAMIVEDLPDGRRYRCNDGEADDDLDDIVFRLERLPS